MSSSNSFNDIKSDDKKEHKFSNNLGQLLCRFKDLPREALKRLMFEHFKYEVKCNYININNNTYKSK